MARLKEQYQNEIVDALIKKFGYKNIMEVPKLDKVVINMGVGEAKDNAKYELDDRPIEEGCQCPACRRYSRAYIRHLLKAKEMLGMRLCVLHNLYYYNNLIEEIRGAIEEGRYKEFKKEALRMMEEKEN